MIKRLIYIVVILLGAVSALQAQNTFGIAQGIGSGFVRAYPSIESKSVYGLSTTSFMWRNYSSELNLGCVGVDVEIMQRGFAYAPYTTTNNTDDDRTASDLLYYYRYINSIMVPLIWQPYVYMFDNRVRVFADAAVTFSYNYSSTYQNDLYNSYGYNDPAWEGEYDMREERDNKWGYGLAFGGGITYIIDRIEIQASMRYYFGYSDILKNRNKYYSNTTDGPENPFSYTPQRSPLDNFNFKFGVSYRVGKADGYSAWLTKRIKSTGLRDGFEYDGVDSNNSPSGASSRGGSSGGSRRSER
ncbi:MAG: PorT family protein [Rikenellaceae bacterium]